MKDMLHSSITHTPDRRVDRVASTPLDQQGMGIEERRQIYDRVLRLAADPNLLPLTLTEAVEYLDSISERPLQPNTLFPPSEMILARSIKTTRQYATIQSSKICVGRGLWLKPGVAISKGAFLGIYAGWVTDDSDIAIWDMEDLDKSYSLGLIGLHYVQQQDNHLAIKQAVVHAQDRRLSNAQDMFPLSCANEWIWQSEGSPTDTNSLRFGKMGMVFANKSISPSKTKIELTIGLGREDTPFTGWTNYKKNLMLRLLEVLHIIVLDVQCTDTLLHLQWQHLFEDLRDITALLRYNTLELLREDRSALAILLAGVENESEMDDSITIIYNKRESMLDNLRRMVQHVEVRKRCNFRHADRPSFPSTSSTGSSSFWRRILVSELSRVRPELSGTRRSQRVTPQAFSETNVVVLIDSAGRRRRISTIPIALLPDNSESGNLRIDRHSLHICQGRECVAVSTPEDTPDHCSVRFEDGSTSMVQTSELHPPQPGDFMSATWTLEETTAEIRKVRTDPIDKYNGPHLYGHDYRIVEDQMIVQGVAFARDHFYDLARQYGTSLAAPLHSSNLRIATWSSSGLKSIRKLRLLIALMGTASIDILCIQDTRIEPGLWSEELIKVAKADLGPGASVLLAPVSARAPGSMGANVGGQLILKSPRAGVVTNFWMDPSTLGVVCSFDLKMGGADLRIVSVYVPPDRGAISAVVKDGHIDEPISTLDGDFVFRGNLNTRLSQFTDSYRQGMSPAEYILSTAQNRTQLHLSTPGTSVICVGDFNANGSHKCNQSINGHIGDWSQSVGLLNATSILSPKGDCPSTFYRQGAGISDIDHILFSRDRGLLPIGWRVLDESLWLTMSNHCPLTIDFEIPQFAACYCSRRKRRRRDRKRHLDISRHVHDANNVYQQRDVDMYRKYLKRLNQTPATDPQDRFADIMRVTKSALLSISRRRRKASLWSPEIVALTANQIAVTEMGRYLDGLKGRHQWKSQPQIDQGMQIILSNWERQISKLSEADTNKEHDNSYWLNYSSKGPEHWKTLSWERGDLTAQVLCEKRRISKLISQRNRTEWNESILNRNNRRIQTRLQGKHLRELRSLLGSGHTPFSMDYLIVDNKLLLNESQIHAKVTEHFSHWFKKTDTPWGFHNSENDFVRLWQDKDYFIRSHDGSAIPEHLLDIVWTAMRSREHPVEEDHDSLEILLSAAPTLEEFQEAIRLSPIHSAGGPTEVTYNAVAAWDVQLVEEVHTLLSTMWKDKMIPTCWKWRWLVPIPKVQDNVSLDDLRPLMLTDVTRKLWIGIVVNKIQHYWRQQGLLSEAQHGFLEHKSTEGALLQFRNVLEEARESCTDVFLSSWDVRRAFDRVPKNLLTLGWMRLGVPQYIAEYLVGIDVGGLTIVRTPFAVAQWDKVGAEGFSEGGDGDKVASFCTETGTGQGNIDSPLNWTAIMDILLRALHTANNHPFYVRTHTQHGCGLSETPDIAYADDLISLTSRLDGLQQKSDVVCAFCLVFGLEIAVSKLRAYKVHWGGEHTDNIGLSNVEGDALSHFVSIHLAGWTCRKVKVNSFETAPPIKYLGVLFDLTNLDSSAKEWARQTARSLISRLYDRTLDADLKLDAVVQVIFPKLLYSAQFASWTLQEFITIDEMFSTYFRQFLGLRKSFPSELLYASEVQCGVGLPRFSNEAHARKLAVLFRGFQSDPDTKQATCNLLLRGLRLQNSRPAFTQYAVIAPIRFPQPLFIRSIVSWLDIASLRLAKGGQEFLDRSFTSLAAYFKVHAHVLTEEQTAILEAHGVSSLGDIVTTGPPTFTSLRRGRSRSRAELTMIARKYIGRKIRKLFSPYGIFEGIVLSFLFPWFKVSYTDGDTEDLSLEELLMHLVEDPSPHDSPLQWVQFHSTPLAFLQELLPPLPPALNTILVQRDQCFASANVHYPMDEGWIWELLGIKDELICIRTWRYSDRCCPLQGDQVTLESLSLGAATTVWLPRTDMFCGHDERIEGTIYRVILGPDINKRKIHRVIIDMFQQPLYDFSTPEMEVPLFQSLFEEIPFLKDTQCFTDGSLHQDLNPVVEALIPPSITSSYRQLGSVPSSSGALVVRRVGVEAQEQSELMIRVTQGEEVRCGSSYDIELILLTLGCVLRWMAAVFTSPGVVIDLFSDCKSAIDKANMTDLKAIRHLGHKEHGLLLRQIYESRFSSDAKVSHVYGHPERRLGREDSWQHLKGEDAGIYIADKIAGAQFSALETKRPLIEKTAVEVLTALRCLQECVIVRDNGVPILEDPLSLVQHAQFTSYLSNRDKSRSINRWTTYIRSAPKILHPCGKSFSMRARRTKLVFNWYLREEHVHRGVEKILCPLCSHDIQGDTERHLYTFCQDVEIENIRLEAIDTLRHKALGDIPHPKAASIILAKLFRLLTESDDRHLLRKGIIPISSWSDLMDSVTDYNFMDRRAIVDGIRDMLSLTGEAVRNIRRSYWLSRLSPSPPTSIPGQLTPGQLAYISSQKQTRLPIIWGIMSPTEQIDWEVRRRLRNARPIDNVLLTRKRIKTPTHIITKNLITSYMPLTPAKVIINKLLTKPG